MPPGNVTLWGGSPSRALRAAGSFIHSLIHSFLCSPLYLLVHQIFIFYLAHCHPSRYNTRSACPHLSSRATQEPHLFIYTHIHRTHTRTPSGKSSIFHQDLVNQVNHIWRTARRFLIWGLCIACKQAMTRTMRQCQQKVKKHPFLLYWRFLTPLIPEIIFSFWKWNDREKKKKKEINIHLGPCETTS